MTTLKKVLRWPVLFTLVLSIFTAYVIMDTFVIERSYVNLSPDSESGSSNNNFVVSDLSSGTGSNSSGGTSSTTTSGSAKVTDNYYSDGNVTIQISTYRKYNSNIYVADVTLSTDASLKTAFAKNTFGKNVTATTSDIASDNNAILAINGDYYGVRNGYVIRNGTLYRDTSSDDLQQDLVIYSDGSFRTITEASESASALLESGAQQVLSFGPTLVDNSKIVVTENQEVDRAKSSNPRTSIGIIDNLHYVFVVADGRTSASSGLSLYELAEFMQGLHVTCAYNLDGGGSSTMYFNGKVVNNPTSNGRDITERKVSDIVYISKTY